MLIKSQYGTVLQAKEQNEKDTGQKVNESQHDAAAMDQDDTEAAIGPKSDDQQ